MAPLASIHNKSVLYINCYVCCTATIVRPLPAICILYHQHSKFFCICGNSKAVETTGSVSDWVTCNVLCQLCPKIGPKFVVS